MLSACLVVDKSTVGYVEIKKFCESFILKFKNIRKLVCAYHENVSGVGHYHLIIFHYPEAHRSSRLIKAVEDFGFIVDSLKGGFDNHLIYLIDCPDCKYYFSLEKEK